MIFCQNCGSPIEGDASFCPSCGSKIENTANGRDADTAFSATDTVFGSTESFVDTRDFTPHPGIAVLSFLIFWVGLIIWSVNREKRPGLATSAIKGVVSALCVAVPLAGLFMFIAWIKEKRDFAKVAGISAIVGVAVIIFLYICFYVLLFTMMLMGA